MKVFISCVWRQSQSWVITDYDRALAFVSSPRTYLLLPLSSALLSASFVSLPWGSREAMAAINHPSWKYNRLLSVSFPTRTKLYLVWGAFVSPSPRTRLLSTQPWLLPTKTRLQQTVTRLTFMTSFPVTWVLCLWLHLYTHSVHKLILRVW